MTNYKCVKTVKERGNLLREEELERKRTLRRKVKKYAFIGAASVGGGVLLGLTGGLAAPLIGASVGALLGNHRNLLLKPRFNK